MLAILTNLRQTKKPTKSIKINQFNVVVWKPYKHNCKSKQDYFENNSMEEEKASTTLDDRCKNSYNSQLVLGNKFLKVL